MTLVFLERLIGNSISLQDIPQSVIRIRREKELRQIKEEIEYLKTIAQEEKEKAAAQGEWAKERLLFFSWITSSKMNTNFGSALFSARKIT